MFDALGITTLVAASALSLLLVVATALYDGPKVLRFKIFTRKSRPHLVGIGGICTMVRWTAWRESRPMIRGYGMTKREAIDDLKYRVQPDWDGTLDGEGRPRGCLVGGNTMTQRQIIAFNRLAFRGRQALSRLWS